MSSILAAIAAVFASAAVQANDVGASDNLGSRAANEFRRVQLSAPNFPAACAGMTQANASATVVVSFKISPGRNPTHLEVVSATDDCFTDAAKAAVRTSVFLPVTASPDWEGRYVETIEFKFDAIEAAEYRSDPIKRLPPVYPSHCFRKATAYEAVLVGFDVNPEGHVENARIIDSTYPCIELAALQSVRKWRYEPVPDSESALLTGHEAVVTFEVDNYTQWTRARKAVVDKLSAAQKSLNKGASPTEILAVLEEIENAEGRTFVRGEVELFYAVRSNARVEAKDYAGALDDVRTAGRAGNMLVDWRKLAAQRKQLEAVIDEPRGWKVSEGAIQRFETSDLPNSDG